VLPLYTHLIFLFKLELCMNICQFFFLLVLENLGINVFNGRLDVCHAWGGDCNGPRGENLQRGFWIPNFIGDSGMKLRLIRGLFECLGEGNDFDCKWQSACSKHVDNPPILDPDVLVFVI